MWGYKPTRAGWFKGSKVRDYFAMYSSLITYCFNLFILHDWCWSCVIDVIAMPTFKPMKISTIVANITCKCLVCNSALLPSLLQRGCWHSFAQSAATHWQYNTEDHVEVVAPADVAGTHCLPSPPQTTHSHHLYQWLTGDRHSIIRFCKLGFLYWDFNVCTLHMHINFWEHTSTFHSSTCIIVIGHQT